MTATDGASLTAVSGTSFNEVYLKGFYDSVKASGGLSSIFVSSDFVSFLNSDSATLTSLFRSFGAPGLNIFDFVDKGDTADFTVGEKEFALFGHLVAQRRSRQRHARRLQRRQPGRRPFLPS
ncbi:hypothetical protein [Aeoliella mucimassa]|uniref:hypothetical protein n=1 Tax=Aeoliella mucimassa TaxID=2527972 RepID=UPI001E452E33|nr:hypothetical protein [Aeoliella mucimassa]